MTIKTNINLRKLLFKFKPIDLFAVGLILIVGSFFLFFFKREGGFVNIRVRVTDTDALYVRTDPYNWYADKFIAGDSEKDAVGGVTAKIENVESFNIKSDKRIVFLDISIYAKYDPKTGIYSARGKPLTFGSTVPFNFTNVSFEGLVIGEPGFEKKPEKTEYVLVKARARGYVDKPELIGGTNKVNTNTIEPEVLESVLKGDKVITVDGDVLVEVVDSVIYPSERAVATNLGGLVLTKDPIYKDAIYTLKVRSKKVGNEIYVFDVLPLKIGEVIPLNFNDVSIFPTIINIIDAD